MVVRVPELIQHVLRNPKSYPGPHNESQERTSKGVYKLDTTRQFRLIFDAMIIRLQELLHEGQGVSIPQFGTFVFAPVWHHSKYGPDMVSKSPVFVASHELKKACPAYSGKEQVDVDRGAISSAQSVPTKVMFLNEVPIAGGCYYRVEVVRSAMKQLFTAILDLADRGYDLELDLGAVLFRVMKRNLEYKFTNDLIAAHKTPARVKGPGAQEKGTVLSSTWKKPEFSAAMGTFLERPKSREVHDVRIATANLAVMGKDLTTCN